MRIAKLCCRLGVSALLALLPSALLKALPDDREQAISITADRASRDELAGQTEYVGDVVLKQGSLIITAERIVIHHDNDDANLIIATGSPATLEQQPSVEQAKVFASAGTIEYQRTDDRIKLSEGAKIEQNGAVVTGDIIDYLVAEQKVNAGADNTSQRRVEVTIPPATSARSGAASETNSPPETDSSRTEEQNL